MPRVRLNLEVTVSNASLLTLLEYKRASVLDVVQRRDVTSQKGKKIHAFQVFAFHAVFEQKRKGQASKTSAKVDSVYSWRLR